MLPDASLNLLTAAADGELSPNQRALLARLLAESEEARLVHAELCRDAERLREMPRLVAPIDVSAVVLRRVRRVSPAVVPARRRSPVRWLVPTLAAGVLSVAGLATLRAPEPNGQRPPEEVAVAPRGTPGPVPTSRPEPIPEPAALVRAEPVPAPRLADSPRVAPADAPALVAAEPARPRPADALLSPARPAGEPLQAVEATLPLILETAELARPEGRARLAALVTRGPAVRVEWFTREPGILRERMAKSLRAAGDDVLVEPALADRLRRGLPAQPAVLLDGLGRDRLLALLETLADGGALSGRVVVTGFVPSDYAELAAHLGVPAAQLRRGTGLRQSPARPEVVPGAPLAGSTASQLAQGLARPATKDAPRKAYYEFLFAPARPAAERAADLRQLTDAGARPADPVLALLLFRPRRD